MVKVTTYMVYVVDLGASSCLTHRTEAESVSESQPFTSFQSQARHHRATIKSADTPDNNATVRHLLITWLSPVPVMM